MKRAIEKKQEEINRLKKVSIEYNKQNQQLKGKKHETATLAKQVYDLTDQVANLTEMVKQTNAKNNLVQESLREDLKMKERMIRKLSATVARQN